MSDPKPTIEDNPDYRCRVCGSKDVWYTEHTSSCGGYEDIRYECRGCERVWWFESSDA